jgi:hypothetical protein
VTILQAYRPAALSQISMPGKVLPGCNCDFNRCGLSRIVEAQASANDSLGCLAAQPKAIQVDADVELGTDT